MGKATSARIAASFALVALLALPGAADARPQEPLVPPQFLTPDPGFAEIGKLPDPLAVRNLGRAALLASGVTQDRLAAYESRLDSLYGELKAETGGKGDGEARGEAALEFLHKRVFKAYREDATTLDGVLDTGVFNCVSSAVLYMLAAESLGLKVEGARTPDHAFCVLVTGRRRIDVETTNPYGFDPGNKKEFKDSFGRATGYAYVAPGSYGSRTTIGGRSLVGLILWNRVSALERQRRFPEAAKLGVDCDKLVPGAESRSFLAQRINNLVADLEARRDLAGAEAAAQAAAAAYPGEASLAALAQAASYNRAVDLANSGNWEAAFTLAAVAKGAAQAGSGKARAAAPDGTQAPGEGEWSELMASALVNLARARSAQEDYDGARRAVAERAPRAGASAAAKAYAAIGEDELVRAANKLPFAEAERVADRVLSAREVSVDRYGQALAAIYGNEAGRMGKAGDWLGGAALADQGAAKLAAAKAPGDRTLFQLAQTLRHNFTAEAHNRFARLYNAGDYRGAAAEARKALAALPDEPILTRDLAAAEAAAGASSAN